uniref:Molecular chaperone HtpG n=1 Tax=Candidatus Kentrum sp. TUN TaxID=2126343 RepID=A0A450ZYD1_9GAMM|nr:MAG: molecular chaperone HtpG [Candidatus Kentron sp. TUN]
MPNPNQDPQKHTISINLPGLLRMLGENIYAEPDVAIREMIQNAHDTCIIRGARDSHFRNPEIHISFDKNRQTITILDNGAGMTEEELHRNLATIGESFTRIQREEFKNKDAREAALLIGQFGIGLLSAFSISKRVEVITRSAQSQDKNEACRWVCEGDIHYTVEPLDESADFGEPGTRITLYLLDTKLELLAEDRLRQAIKKYADFLSIPIYLNGTQANACTPPWEIRRTTTEGEGKISAVDLSEYIQSRWSLYPLGIIPFDTETMAMEDGEKRPLRVSGLLFVPVIPSELARDFGELDIYISRMFIKANDKELLPPWARFVKGVIDTPDLTPTLSRGEVIIDEKYQLLRTLLSEIIIDWLDHLQAQDPNKLKMLVGSYNNTIKARALEDDEFFDRICHLVRVETDRGVITIGEYLESSDNTLYYFAERGTGTQHKVLFAHKGLPVIDASWGMEEEFLEKYAQRKGCRIERLTAGAGSIFTVPETLDEKWRALERDFHHATGMEAKAAEFAPASLPAVLVGRAQDKTDKQFAELDGIGAQMGISSNAIKQMFGRMAKNKTRSTSGSGTLIHLNITNPLMGQLRDMPHTETRRLAVLCIYNNAHMFAHHYVSPENAERIFDSNNQAFSAMITTAQALMAVEKEKAKLEVERDELKRRLPDIQLTKHRSCFFAFDYNVDENHELLKWIQDYFQRKGWGVEVVAPICEITELNIQHDLIRQLQRVHFGIAEISNNNPNVLYEAGFLHALNKPLILLKREEGEVPVPFDIHNNFRVQYKIDKYPGGTEFTRIEKQLDKAMNTVEQMLPGFADAKKWQ